MIYNCQIVYNQNNCLNAKRASDNLCRLCIDSCPHQAISIYRELDAKRCTECGICTAVCPSDGFVYREMDKLYEYLKNSEKNVLNCPQAIPAGHEIPCLGIFDRDLWLALMLYAREKELTIFTGVCTDCPDKKACGISVQIFIELHNAWEDHPPVLIKVAADDGDSESTVSVQAQNESRGWRDIGREKFEEIRGGNTFLEPYLIPKTRQFLEETWKSLKSEIEVLPLPALKVSERCTNCGECPEICPQGALTKTDTKEQLTLIYEPLKCVHCQRCVSICRSKAISMEVKSLSYRLLTGKVLLYQGKRRFCTSCNKQVFDDLEPPLCMACATSNPYGSFMITQHSRSQV
ncbi:4Fe-4S dicluster domain-containing protein [Desulfosporosinus lacus]|uniref:Ferredoxin n=1 Tax=Desulfosporosinus lacus DSM 15449 TaxID=1121420 RepID=A0A1M6FP28_9FIRM|nr:4Fe-4S dicluster domain-containing protein [Desulfosporosinus lacus]SHI99424.1 4Fe-4S dicluster domain-containing protein [Desulfosporosinus lacus DSM 15449]